MFSAYCGIAIAGDRLDPNVCLSNIGMFYFICLHAFFTVCHPFCSLWLCWNYDLLSSFSYRKWFINYCNKSLRSMIYVSKLNKIVIVKKFCKILVIIRFFSLSCSFFFTRKFNFLTLAELKSRMMQQKMEGIYVHFLIGFHGWPHSRWGARTLLSALCIIVLGKKFSTAMYSYSVYVILYYIVLVKEKKVW